MKTKLKKVKNEVGLCFTRKGIFCFFLKPEKSCNTFDLKTKKSVSKICAEENVIFTKQ